jgi:hypothetical protein
MSRRIADTTIIAQEGSVCNKFIANFSIICSGVGDKNRQITSFDHFERAKSVL